jgi:hypothetical protein
MMEAVQTSEALVNSTSPHGATSQKTAIFIVTAVETSSHTLNNVIYLHNLRITLQLLSFLRPHSPLYISIKIFFSEVPYFSCFFISSVHPRLDRLSLGFSCGIQFRTFLCPFVSCNLLACPDCILSFLHLFYNVLFHLHHFPYRFIPYSIYFYSPAAPA